MDCIYHKILEKLNDIIWEIIENEYDSPYFSLWLGDESYLGRIYKETFEEILEGPLTDTQISIIEKNGVNLEIIINKWCKKWKTNNPELQNQKLPKYCLKIKIYEYIIYQLNRSDLSEIIGRPC